MKNNTTINSDFVKNGADKTSDKDLDEVLNRKSQIENKLANSGLLTKYGELGKIMLTMLNDYRKGAYKKVPWFTITTIGFTLLYVLNPFDLMPDFIPVVGYVDDVSVMAMGLNFIETDLHTYLSWKEQNREIKQSVEEEEYDYEY